MKSGYVPHGLVLAAALALSSSAAFAASGEPQVLSDSELAQVYGRGLSDPALNALGALTTPAQDSGAVSATASDAIAGAGALSAEAQSLDRQLAQQRLQTTAPSLQAALKITQTMQALDKALAPLAGSASLLVTPFPLLFMLPALSTKH